MLWIEFGSGFRYNSFECGFLETNLFKICGSFERTELGRKYEHESCYLSCQINLIRKNCSIHILLTKDTPKAFGDFKNKQKSAWNNVFGYVEACIFWKFIQYSRHWDKMQVLQKFPLGKINVEKIHSFFFCEPQFSTVFFLIRDVCMS